MKRKRLFKNRHVIKLMITVIKRAMKTHLRRLERNGLLFPYIKMKSCFLSKVDAAMAYNLFWFPCLSHYKFQQTFNF